MSPEEQFLRFASEHSEEYVKGWLDGFIKSLEVLQSISKKAEYKNSTSEVD